MFDQSKLMRYRAWSEISDHEFWGLLPMLDSSRSSSFDRAKLFTGSQADFARAWAIDSAHPVPHNCSANG